MFTLGHALYAGLGYVAGAFTPGVLRYVKSKLTSEAKKAEGYVSAEVDKGIADVKKKV